MLSIYFCRDGSINTQTPLAWRVDEKKNTQTSEHRSRSVELG